MKIKFTWKIVSIALACVLVVSTVSFAVALSRKPDKRVAQVGVDVSVLNLGETVSTASTPLVESLMSGALASNVISSTVAEVLYSDSAINLIMSIAYPMLYNVLEELKMLDYCNGANLYPTGTELASLLEGSAYTCYDKDGTQKLLCEVLRNVSDDWSYMSSTVSMPAKDLTQRAVPLWSTIHWGVTDENSFYTVLSDMSKGMRGVLEVCLQNKSHLINVNVIEALTKKESSLPINLDAATIFNGFEEQGYKKCMVSLYNMLGLNEGEYVSPEEFGGYTELIDMWRALLSPVMTAIKKIEAQPKAMLGDLLLNFAAAIDNGTLVENLLSLRMDGDFHILATLAMGFKDGLLHNLGDTLISTIEELGIKITGNFNDLLDSLVKTITGKSDADLPTVDVAKLLSLGTAQVLPNGNTYYDADENAVFAYLSDYIFSSEPSA